MRALLLTVYVFQQLLHVNGAVPVRSPANRPHEVDYPGSPAHRPGISSGEGSSGSSSSNGGSTSVEKQDSLGHALEQLSELLKELIPDLVDSGSGSSSSSIAHISTKDSPSRTATARTTGDRSTITSAAAVADATGCLSAQSLYGYCSQIWVPVTSGEDVLSHIADIQDKGPFWDAAATDQASCLCYTSASTNASLPLFLTSYDGWISQCDAYLQTGKLPATTTVSGASTPVAKTAVQAQISGALGQCAKVGDVRAAVTSPTAAAAPVPSPSAAMNGWERILPSWGMLLILMVAILWL